MSDVADALSQNADLPARMLVVDDESAVRQAIRRMLEAEGCLVTTAEDGATALRLLETTDTPDLLITDVEMPGLAGDLLADQVRKRWPELPILFVSGNRRYARLPAAHGRLGGFLLKPFDRADLLALTRQALGNGAFRSADARTLSDRD